MSVAVNGLWKVKETVERGFYAQHPATHYLFSDGRLRRFRYSERFASLAPEEVDEGPYRVVEQAGRTTFEFMPAAASKALRWLVRLDGEKLEIGFRPNGELPAELSSTTESVVRLLRDAMRVPPVRAKKKPAPLDHPYFGRVGCDPAAVEWRCHVDWRGGRMPVTFVGDDLDDPSLALAVGAEICRDLARWCARAELFAAQTLVTTKNERWREDGEPGVSVDGFRACMSIMAIEIDGHGTFTFIYHVGDLFWGHVLHVSGTLEHGPESTDIVG